MSVLRTALKAVVVLAISGAVGYTVNDIMYRGLLSEAAQYALERGLSCGDAAQQYYSQGLAAGHITGPADQVREFVGTHTWKMASRCNSSMEYARSYSRPFAEMFSGLAGVASSVYAFCGTCRRGQKRQRDPEPLESIRVDSTQQQVPGCSYIRRKDQDDIDDLTRSFNTFTGGRDDQEACLIYSALYNAGYIWLDRFSKRIRPFTVVQNQCRLYVGDVGLLVIYNGMDQETSVLHADSLLSSLTRNDDVVQLILNSIVSRFEGMMAEANPNCSLQRKPVS